MELAVYIYDALAQEHWQTGSLLGGFDLGFDPRFDPRFDPADQPAHHANCCASVKDNQTNTHLSSAHPANPDMRSDTRLDHSVGQRSHFDRPTVDRPRISRPTTNSTEQQQGEHPITHHSIRKWLLRLWLGLPLGILLQITLGLWGWLVTVPSPSYGRNLSPNAFCAPIYLCQTNYVLTAQRLLAQKGYYRAAIDGVYGEATWAATVQFQQDYDQKESIQPQDPKLQGTALLIDGIVGPQTMAALQGVPRTAPQPLPDSSGSAYESDTKPKASSPQPSSSPQVKPTPNPEANPKSEPSAPIRLKAPPEEVALKNAPDLTPADEDESQSASSVVAIPQRQIRNIQAQLQQSGFYGGPISGIYDAATKEAISLAQKEYGLVNTGEWNEKLADALSQQVNPRSRSG